MGLFTYCISKIKLGWKMFTCYKITFSSVLIHNYTTVQKFGVNKILFNYINSARKHYIDLK